MAKKEKLDYSRLLSELRESGPMRLYLLWGEEDYLKEQFFLKLRSIVVNPDTSEFNHRRINGPDIDAGELSGAVDALPFFAERTLVEVRGFDINKCRESAAAALDKICADLPEYCTLVFIMDTAYEPDGRLAAVKNLKKRGRAIEFTTQNFAQLYSWIQRRFKQFNKSIGRPEAEHLIFCSGGLMTRMIPEIEKLASFTQGDFVSKEDIDAVVQRLPEEDVFNMTEKLAQRNFDEAAAIMSGLLEAREHPVMILAMIGQQMRRLYAARLAIDEGLGRDFVSEVCGIRFDFITSKLMSAAKELSLNRLRRAVTLAAGYDYEMKSSGTDDKELLKELFLRIATEMKSDQR